MNLISNLEEIIQGLCHQLKESKEELRDLKEKLLISEATVYSLANQLHKYECGKHKDVIESVLGEKLQHKEGKLPERLMPDRKLSQFLFFSLFLLSPAG
uniref:Uncharacterized protein n=1 Tax=Sciurus vulgaris TaxID=55149 RepID=A0A8D2AJ16_SCIVU